MSLRAVLFDLDGLLVDSEPVWSIAEAEVMAWLGGPWNAEVKATLVGRRLDDGCRIMATIAGSAVPAEEVRRYLLTRMCELFEARLPLLPGALTLVEAVRAAGLRTALVSSSYRVLVDAVLTSLGSDRFDVTVAGDEVAEPKPDPEGYLRAAAALGVRPADCVVIEDSAAGVAAGERAGCAVVAVPNVVPVPPGPGHADAASLTEIDVGWLATLVPPG